MEKQVLVLEDTVFEWGSISKLLIWVSVFQLWEKRKIDLNEYIRTYLPRGFSKKVSKNQKITSGHGGTTKAFPSNLLVDPISKTSAIIMTNQSYESVYNFEILPIILGDFNPSKPSMPQKKRDVGGIYGSARTSERGYGKLHSIISRVKIKEED